MCPWEIGSEDGVRQKPVRLCWLLGHCSSFQPLHLSVSNPVFRHHATCSRGSLHVQLRGEALNNARQVACEGGRECLNDFVWGYVTRCRNGEMLCFSTTCIMMPPRTPRLYMARAPQLRARSTLLPSGCMFTRSEGILPAIYQRCMRTLRVRGLTADCPSCHVLPAGDASMHMRIASSGQGSVSSTHPPRPISCPQQILCLIFLQSAAHSILQLL